MPSCDKKGPSAAKLDGKTVIITGCNTGIGKETARDLFKRGARVILACRDEAKAQLAADEIRKDDASRPDAVIVRKLDLSSMSSIRSFASDILEAEPKIDILINNAGVMMCPYQKTEDGFEMQLGTNHFGHFLLTNLLLDRIIESAPSRIINVSSSLHQRGTIKFDDLQSEKSYGQIAAYSQSKLANVLFTRELAKKLKGTGVTTYSLHPGAVRTDLQRHHNIWGSIISPFMKTPVQGAQTTIYCAVNEELAEESGLYYSDCKAVEPSRKAKDDAVAKKLWDISCELVKIENK